MAKGKQPRIEGFARNRNMYQAIYEGDLKFALKEIEDNPLSLETPVNALDDKPLHVAISKEKWKIAEEIVKLMEDDQLEMRNLKGDTPFHEAASKGKVSLTTLMLTKNQELPHIRNSQQEIPLHKAALYGHTDMFNHLCCEKSDVFARREGGANVLHCAVMGTHLELAEKIAKRYPELRLHRDHQGMTPLHLLVTNPKTYKSGSQLGTMDSFIYHSILPKEDNLLQGGDEGGMVPNHTRGDDDDQGKPPMENFSEAMGDEENVLASMDSTTIQSSKKLVHEKFPPNYITCFHIFALISRARSIGSWTHSLYSFMARWIHSLLFGILSKMFPGFHRIKELKKMHGQALRLVEFLAGKGGEYWIQLNKGRSPLEESSNDHPPILEINQGKNMDGPSGADRGKEMPHILAARMGAASFVSQILTIYPKSANLTGDDGKNILQVAVEQRQDKIVRLIESTEDWRRNTVSGKDQKSDTILHSAARLGNTLENLVPGSALHMQRELQWFERVEKMIPLELVYHRNLEGETAQALFTTCHAEMVRSSKDQLIATAQSCSTLVAAVVFATSFSIPGGTDQSGQALFLGRPAFKVFTNAYVVGLSCAATALLLFVSLIISPYNEQEFRRSLPTKFTLAFISLFLALMSMVVAFSSNIYLTINGKRSAGDIVPLVCELTIFPAFAFAVLLYQRASFGVLSTIRDVLG